MREERREQEEERGGEEGELAALPPDSHMDSGSLGSDWLKVSLSAAAAPGLVCKWLSGAAAVAALSPE